jgi:hypothetical protein
VWLVGWLDGQTEERRRDGENDPVFSQMKNNCVCMFACGWGDQQCWWRVSGGLQHRYGGRYFFLGQLVSLMGEGVRCGQHFERVVLFAKCD